MTMSIPAVALSSVHRPMMPLVGLGTYSHEFIATPEQTRLAALQAIELGYRHFDTAALYRSEQPLGAAIAEALRRGLIGSRAELFITTKLWCNDSHPDRVLPALQTSLRNLQLEYVDLYLIHMPVSGSPGPIVFPIHAQDLLPMDLKSVWEAMEECQNMGLTKSIGVSNFSIQKLQELLLIAKIPPAVNQVEMNPVWQQRELREFCGENGIVVTAYCPLGGQYTEPSRNLVIGCETLNKIAQVRGKTLFQISLRWIYEQGVIVIPKSFNKERMEENLQIFDWELSKEEAEEISLIPQFRLATFELTFRGRNDSLAHGYA